MPHQAANHIVLGGNIEPEIEKIQADDELSPEQKEEKIKQITALWKARHEEVVRLGGLHIIGTERHESRRIDNQLRGRSGRQGDPGSSVFYVSLEDDLMRLFGSDNVKSIMERLGMEEDLRIEHPMIAGLKRAEKVEMELGSQIFSGIWRAQSAEVIYKQHFRSWKGKIQDNIMHM